MDVHTKRIVRVIILSWMLLLSLIIALAVLIFVAFGTSAKAVHKLDVKVSQLQDMKMLPGPQGPPGESIVGPVGPQGPAGPQGEPGKDSTSTITIVQQPVQGPQGIQGQAGPQGMPGISSRQIEFDGNGHWRYAGDDEWLPLVKEIQ